MNSHALITTADALRLLREYGDDLADRGLATETAAEWSDVLGRLELLLKGTPNGHAAPDAVFPFDANRVVQSYRMRYRELFDFFTEGCLITDLRGVILEANHAAAALLRVRKEFLLDKPLPLFVGEERRAGFYSLLLRMQKEVCTVRDWHAPLRPLRGEPVEVLIWVAGMSDEVGRPTALRWLLRDVTSLLAAERALREERNFAEGLLDNAQAIILVLQDDNILQTNRYLRQVSGYEELHLRGKNWMLLAPEESREAAHEMVWQAQASV